MVEVLSDFVYCGSLDAARWATVISLLESCTHRKLSQVDHENLREWQRSQSHIDFSRVTSSVWLSRMGSQVTSAVQQLKGIENKQRAPIELEVGLHSVVEPGKPRVALVNSQHDMLPTMLSFYSSVGRVPRADEVLFCRGNALWQQLDAFVARCIHVPGLYCMVHVERLSYQKQHQLVECLARASATHVNFHIVLLVLSDGGAALGNVHVLRELPSSPAHALSEQGVQQVMRHLAPHLFCFASDDAASGKTELIRHRAHARGLCPVTVPINGPLNIERLIDSLQSKEWKKWHCLHLDVGHSHVPELLSDLLAQIGLWRVLQSGSAIFAVPCDVVYVELANLSDTQLLRNLPFCTLARPSMVSFSLRNFCISTMRRSPVQVVCHTLHSLEAHAIDTQELAFEQKEPLPAHRCRELLETHIVRRLTGSPTYALVHCVLRLLASQLVSFSVSTYFACKTLADLRIAGSVRSQLVRGLLESVISFTARAVSAAKLRQRGHVSRAATLDSEFGHMARWSDVPPMLLFNRFDRQTLSLVFRKEASVPQTLVDMFRSQAVGKSWKLPNYVQMNTSELEERLGRIVLPLESKLGKAVQGSTYVVSPDNFLKMIWIALRIENQIPVIIMGETGCGKTSLIRHLARLLDADFKCLNIHAGTSEDQIHDFIESCKAPGNTPRQTWAFLDEINTCDHLGMIADLLCHRQLGGRPLPHGLVLLAACNPYRRKIEVADAGVALTLANSSQRRKHADLVYSVHELPEIIFEYLWDFGELGPEEERSYIEAMSGDVFPEDRSWTRVVANLISMSQDFVTRVLPDALLSLRDVKRCVDLITWFKVDHGILSGWFVLRESIVLDIGLFGRLPSLRLLYHKTFDFLKYKMCTHTIHHRTNIDEGATFLCTIRPVETDGNALSTCFRQVIPGIRLFVCFRSTRVQAVKSVSLGTFFVSFVACFLAWAWDGYYAKINMRHRGRHGQTFGLPLRRIGCPYIDMLGRYEILW